MTTAVMGAVEGRPPTTPAGMQRALERARMVAAGRSEMVRAERAELEADVKFLKPRVNAFASVATELGPEFLQIAWAIQNRLDRMARRAGSVVL